MRNAAEEISPGTVNVPAVKWDSAVDFDGSVAGPHGCAEFLQGQFGVIAAGHRLADSSGPAGVNDRQAERRISPARSPQGACNQWPSAASASNSQRKEIVVFSGERCPKLPQWVHDRAASGRRDNEASPTNVDSNGFDRPEFLTSDEPSFRNFPHRDRAMAVRRP